MKATTSFYLAISLAIGATGTAQADWSRHGDHRSNRHEYHHHQKHHDHRYGQRSNWIGPAAILAITGLAIGAAAYSQANAAPVYVAPPQPVQPLTDSGNWYYCDSSGQYYPYVRHCPEGWLPVMPPR